MEPENINSFPEPDQPWVFWARRWAVRNFNPSNLGEYQILVDKQRIRVLGPQSIAIEMDSIDQVQVAGAHSYGGSLFFVSAIHRAVTLRLEDKREIEILLVDPLNPVDSPCGPEEGRDLVDLVKALRGERDLPVVEKCPYRRRAAGGDRTALVERQLIDSMISPWELVSAVFPWRRELLPHMSVRKALVQAAVVLILIVLAGLVVLLKR